MALLPNSAILSNRLEMSKVGRHRVTSSLSPGPLETGGAGREGHTFRQRCLTSFLAVTIETVAATALPRLLDVNKQPHYFAESALENQQPHSFILIQIKEERPWGFFN